MYVDKIASYLKNNFWFGLLENGEPYENGSRFVLEFTCYGISKAAENITGLTYNLGPGLDLHFTGWNNYADLVTGTPLMDEIIARKRDFTTALLQNFAAVGSSWEYGLTPVSAIVNVPMPSVCVNWIGFVPVAYPCIIEVPIRMWSYQLSVPGFDAPLGWHPYELPKLTLNVTSERLAHYGTRYGQQIFSSLHEYLHGEPSLIPNDVFIDMINTAPCNGPHHMPSTDQNDVGINGWRANNRFCRPLKADGWNDFDNTYTYGEFNGLDYMLLHNLYALTRGGVSEPFKNRLNQVSSETLTNPGNHWSYETLEFNGTIQANAATAAAPVALSAGKSVTLKPGFRSQPGSTLRVYTSNYDACNTSPQQSSALRTDQSKIKTQSVDTLAIQESINKSLASKFQDATRGAIEKASMNTEYTPLSIYLEKRGAEIQRENHFENVVSLYPNPTADKLRIAITLTRKQSVRIQLRDLEGKELGKLFNGVLEQGTNEVTVGLEHIKPGAFLVEIEGEFFSDHQRFVKINNR